MENNMLRYSYYIPKSCRTTNLKLINNMNKTSARLKQAHIKFFKRLLDNTYTKSIIKGLLKEANDKDYINDILDLLNEIDYESSIDLTQKCKHYEYVSELELRTMKINNKGLDELQELFN
jgi:hypothetical protein